MTINFETLKIITVHVIDGCDCPATARWFNCRCAKALDTKYKVLPMNWRDVIEDGDRPDCVPAIEGVGEIIAQHPASAKIYYIGPDDKIWGGGAKGETHWQLAQAYAATL